MPTIEQAVSGYRKLRDQKKEVTDKHKEELAPYNDKMEKIENWLGLQLQTQKAESIKTAEGTVYTTKTSSVKIGDWETALHYIVEHGLFHMLERKLSPKDVAAFVEEEKSNFPGTTITNNTNVRVRK
jgi:hypothetical protein